MKLAQYYIIALVVIIIDQFTKMLVYFNMEKYAEGQISIIGDWFKIYYTLNPGMAFGAELGFEYGKLMLSIFRILAIIGIGYYLTILYKNKSSKALMICVALILGGAIGNGIDGTFYGVLLDDNVIPNAITPWFHGQVIDMIYLDICDCYIPHWSPIWGGTYLNLWPIFNIADSAIFVAVGIILIWQKKILAN